MGYLKEQVSYIRGMADGLSIDASAKEGKLIIAMLALLNEMADSVESNETSLDELITEIESIKEDVCLLEAEVYEEEDDLDFSLWAEDDGTDDDLGFVELVCPHCKDTIFFDSGIVNGNDVLVCPSCEKPFRDPEK